MDWFQLFFIIAMKIENRLEIIKIVKINSFAYFVFFFIIILTYLFWTV